MSTQQQVSFKNWQFYVFFATAIFAAGGAWHELAELREYQRTMNIQRTSMQESIIKLEEQMKNLREQIQQLRDRLESKKVVGTIESIDPVVAGKKPKGTL